MVVALVVDASAAYLRRSGLDSLADGAALRGADLGATGQEVYGGGVPDAGTLTVTAAQASRAVAAYLEATGAYRRYPGLTYQVAVEDARVRVELHAPLDLPLDIPSGPGRTTIGATGDAVVGIDP